MLKIKNLLKTFHRRGAETQSLFLLTAPAASLTIKSISLRLCGSIFSF